jgi:hypothetical protein
VEAAGLSRLKKLLRLLASAHGALLPNATTGQSTAALPRSSDIDLFGDFKRVVDLDGVCSVSSKRTGSPVFF